MNIKSEKTEEITWDIELCAASATLRTISGQGTTIDVVHIERKSGGESNCFVSDDEQFIRDVHKALSELILHLDGGSGIKIADPRGGIITVEDRMRLERHRLSETTYTGPLRSNHLIEKNSKYTIGASSGHDQIQ